MKIKRKIFSILLTVALCMSLSIPTFAAENLGTSEIQMEESNNGGISTYSTSLVNYTDRFTYYYNSTFNVPVSSTVTIIYGANMISGNSGSINLRIENYNTNYCYLDTSFSPGTGAYVQHIYLPAGKYKFHLWGQPNTTYACALNFYIP